MGKVPSWFKQDYEPIIDNSIELNKLKEYIGVGRPLMLAPTMDYHKTLWGLSLANSLINDGKIVKYISLYDTAKDTKEIITFLFLKSKPPFNGLLSKTMLSLPYSSFCSSMIP